MKRSRRDLLKALAALTLGTGIPGRAARGQQPIRVGFSIAQTGPISGGGDHQHGARRHQGSDVHVEGIEAQAGRVLARRTSLHDGGDHVDRGVEGDSVVYGGEQESLRASSAGSGSSEFFGIHSRERFEEIDRGEIEGRAEWNDSARARPLENGGVPFPRRVGFTVELIEVSTLPHRPFDAEGLTVTVDGDSVGSIRLQFYGI